MKYQIEIYNVLSLLIPIIPNIEIPQKNLREWIYGGINQLSEIIESLSRFKQAESLLKRLEKVIRKPNK